MPWAGVGVAVNRLGLSRRCLARQRARRIATRMGKPTMGGSGGGGSAPEQSPAANERLSKPAMLDTQTCAKDSCLWRLCSPARERPAFSRSPSRGCRP